MNRRLPSIAALTTAAALLGAQPAMALTDCPSQPQARVVVADQGRLESIISDGRGRLFYTDLTADRLLRLDGPGAEPKVLATGMARPGGLAFDPDGSLVIGYSGGALSGAPGNGMAGIQRIDPETGEKKPFVQGLDQANGLARAPDGSFYTSNNIAGEIVHVLANGTVERNWSNIDSPNGLVIDAQERHLFAAQTFTPAKITRFELANPRSAETYFSAASEDMAAGLAGLTRDAADRLYSAAYGSGQVWRIGTDKQACVLARGVSMASNVAFGGGPPGFERGNLYVVSFNGQVVELADATDRPPAPAPGAPETSGTPALRLSVFPRRTRVGRRTTLRFEVTSNGSPVAGAKIRVGQRLVMSGAKGTAKVVYRFRHSRLVRARASRRGYDAAATTIRVDPAR